ncbi:MAG: class I SAM-dependent methyltransferase [Pseudonocardia sp.]
MPSVAPGVVRRGAARILDALAARIADRVADRLAGPLAEAARSRVDEAVQREADRIIRAVHDVEFRSRRDTLAAGEMDAALAAAKFIAARMPAARVFHDPWSTLSHALELAPAGGMALEFGVFSGQSLKVIAGARSGGEVYGFDSFEGLPEVYRPHLREGHFAVDALPQVEGAELVVGWFADTLPRFLAEHPGPVSFLHLDADLYSSTRTVLELVGPRLRPGSILIFDEFFNFPGWEDHEFRAWEEFCESTGTVATYEAYTSNNEQVVVRIVEAPAGSG